MKISKLLSVLKVASAAFFFACSPVLAQWQVPAHNVPIGTGAGTGFKSATPSTAGYPLTSQGVASDPAYGAISSSALNFLQSGTGAFNLTFDQLYRGIIVTPEMFGDGVACSAASALGIQKAINYVSGLSNRGVIQLSPCTYTYTTPLTISANGITLQGYSSANVGTQLSFVPSAIGQCAISIGNGASIVSNTTIKSLGITSTATGTYKTAICASDASVTTIRDVYVRNWAGGNSGTITGAVANGSGEIRLTVPGASANFNDGWAVAVSGVVGTTEANSGWPITVGANTIDLKGSVFTNAYVSGGTITASSTGLRTMGREIFQVEDTLITADLPLRISVNPNAPVSGIDETNFTNMTFGSAIGTNCVVMVDTGVSITSLKFNGTQSWGGGKDAFCWRDNSSPAISEQIRFENVRREQATVAGGIHYNIQPLNTLYSLQIVSPLIGSGTGYYVRNVANLQIDNGHYLDTGECLNVDATVQNIQINGSYWFPGSTATLTGQTLTNSAGFNPSTGCLPPTATYANAAVGPVSPLTYTAAGRLSIAPAALTKTDDTNVTLTLGGSPSTALLQATSLTLGWTGTLANARLATMATNTVKGNATSGTASPTDLAIASCSTASSALKWTTNTGFGCNTAITATTNANLTGDVTSVGNAASLAAGSASVLNSGTLLAARMPALTGDITTTVGTVATTLATVNSNVGTFGSATQASQVTVNAKGLVTAAANVTVTPAVGSITGLGTGVGTALAIAIGSAGAPVTNGGVLGSPSSIGTLPAFTLGGTISGGGNQINNVIIGSTTPLAGSFTTLAASSTVSGTGFSTYLASPPAIGSTSPSTGAFTTITATSNGTFGTNAISGGTFANGPNAGTGAGSQFVSQLNGVSNIGMGNYSRLISGGAFDATPVIFAASPGLSFYIGGVTVSAVLTAPAASTSATTGTLTISGSGGLGVGGALWTGTYVSTTPTVVGTSGTSCSIKGARWFVTDNNTALSFGAVITSGGSIQTPIYCDGTVWRQGANDNAEMKVKAA